MTPQVAGSAAVRERFQRLAAEWKSKSRYLSNTAQMALLPPYQRIVGKGTPVLPLIFEELCREPDHWFWALEAITEENPVPPESVGQVKLMAQAWLCWAEQHGLMPKTVNRNERTPHASSRRRHRNRLH